MPPDGDQHFRKADVAGDRIALADAARRDQPALGIEMEEEEGALAEIAPHGRRRTVGKPRDLQRHVVLVRPEPRHGTMRLAAAEHVGRRKLALLLRIAPGFEPDAPAAVAPAVTAPTTLPVSTPVLPAEPGAPTSPDAPVGTVEVRPGDTLWGLAARSLGPDASDAQIAAEWPRWYAANASTIGPDPDVLLPGQMLVVPSSDGGAR